MPADKFKQVADALNRLSRLRVSVGVTSETDERPAGGTIGNAALGYIHEHGSPARNIPARPHLGPGILAVQNTIEGYLKQAGLAALQGSESGTMQALHNVGQTARDSIKDTIQAKLDPPIKPESYLSRTSGRAARRSRARRGGQTLIDLARAEAPGATPLLDTSSYIGAITYAVREKQ